MGRWEGIRCKAGQSCERAAVTSHIHAATNYDKRRADDKAAVSTTQRARRLAPPLLPTNAAAEQQSNGPGIERPPPRFCPPDPLAAFAFKPNPWPFKTPRWENALVIIHDQAQASRPAPRMQHEQQPSRATTGGAASCEPLAVRPTSAFVAFGWRGGGAAFDQQYARSGLDCLDNAQPVQKNDSGRPNLRSFCLCGSREGVRNHHPREEEQKRVSAVVGVDCPISGQPWGLDRIVTAGCVEGGQQERECGESRRERESERARSCHGNK